jgi:hypothetical protein
VVLSNCHIVGPVFPALTAVQASLTQLNLLSCYLPGPQAHGLSGLTNLRSLTLHLPDPYHTGSQSNNHDVDTPLDEEEGAEDALSYRNLAIYLRPLVKLTHLSLAIQRPRSDALAITLLPPLPDLLSLSLDLGGRKTDRAALGDLFALTHLTALVLSRICFAQRVVAPLATTYLPYLSNLRKFSCELCRSICESGTPNEMLGTVVPPLATLTVLEDVRLVSLPNARPILGLEDVALFSSLQGLTRLQIAPFKWSTYYHMEGRMFLTSLTNLEVLHLPSLSRCDLSLEPGARQAANPANCAHQELGHEVQITPPFQDALSKLAGLSKINFAQCSLPVSIVRWLRDHAHAPCWAELLQSVGAEGPPLRQRPLSGHVGIDLILP